MRTGSGEGDMEIALRVVARCCHWVDLSHGPKIAAEIAAALAEARTFDKLGADRLADEVATLVRRHVIDSRSPAADALLDYRDPPSTDRADRLATLEVELTEARRALEDAIEIAEARVKAARSSSGEAKLWSMRLDRWRAALAAPAAAAPQEREGEGETR